MSTAPSTRVTNLTMALNDLLHDMTEIITENDELRQQIDTLQKLLDMRLEQRRHDLDELRAARFERDAFADRLEKMLVARETAEDSADSAALKELIASRPKCALADHPFRQPFLEWLRAVDKAAGK